MPQFKIEIDEVSYSMSSLKIKLQISNCMANGCSISKVLLNSDDIEIEANGYDYETYTETPLRDIYLRAYESQTLHAFFKIDNLQDRQFSLSIATPMGMISKALNHD